MRLDRLHADVERLRDLLVGSAPGREPDDPALARGECGKPGADDVAGAGPGGEQLVARTRHQSLGAAEMCELHPGLERLAGLGSAAGPAERGAELDQ
jgi:hypothetical protein